MRVEQEQKVTEDARLFAEQEADAQRHSAHVLQVILIFDSLFWPSLDTHTLFSQLRFIQMT